MAIGIIPTEPHPYFIQSTILDGIRYSLTFRWSDRSDCWHLDIKTLDDETVALSVKLVLGVPLLRNVSSALRPPGELFLFDMKDLDAEPEFEGFGTRWVVAYDEARSTSL